MKLLIIEDNRELSSSVCSYLSSQNYICEAAYNFNQAIDKLNLYEYDCIVLDISLPDGSGLNILKHLTKKGIQDGVIIVSAKNSIDDKILGMKMGADDYLTKPFNMAELSIRIFSIIRRKQYSGKNIVDFENIHVDLMTKRAYYFNKEIPQLTPKEYKLLLLFLSSPNRVISKSCIAEHLLGDNADMFDNYDCIYAHIKNIKNKLKKIGCTEYIYTIYGMGYKFK